MNIVNQSNKFKFIPKDMIYIFILAVVLNIVRIVIFHSLYLAYMLWNIFLAILPFVVSSILLWYANKNKLPTIIFILGSMVWILLLPNAPYIVTDLIHIGRGHGAPILFDTFLLFSSAWLGVLLFVNSLSHIEKILLYKYGNRIALIKVPSIILLVSIGVYIGRYLRFNSWDVFADPTFFGNTWQGVVHPINITEAIIFITTCFFFLCMSYWAWKSKEQK